MLRTIAVQNYRSLHELRVPLGQLTVVTGANGSGKSNLYRALRLLADCAERQVIASLAREGGLPSALWAGPEVISGAVRRGEQPLQGTTRANRVSLQLGFASDDFSYLIDLGIPPRSGSAFDLDPEIKRELVWVGETMRPATLLVKRAGPLVQLRTSGAGGRWEPVAAELLSYESMLTEIGDPREAPELLDVRAQVRSWRFYDHFRTDELAPARQIQIGTRSPVLDHEGRDLAATVQTILEMGDGRRALGNGGGRLPGLTAVGGGDRGSLRPALPRAGAAASAVECGVVRRHPALPAADRGPPQSAAARAVGAERARDQPAPGAAAGAGPADGHRRRAQPAA